MYSMVFLILTAAAFDANEPTRASSSNVGLSTVLENSKRSVQEIQAASRRLNETNQELVAKASVFPGLDTKRWADAFIRDTSLIKPGDAVMIFANSANEVEKILAA